MVKYLLLLVCALRVGTGGKGSCHCKSMVNHYTSNPYYKTYCSEPSTNK